MSKTVKQLRMRLSMAKSDNLKVQILMKSKKKYRLLLW